MANTKENPDVSFKSNSGKDFSIVLTSI